MNHTTIKNWIKVVGCASVACFLCGGCGKQSQDQYHYTFSVLEKEVAVTVPKTPEITVTEAAYIAHHEMLTVSSIFDLNDPDSEMSRINRIGAGIRYPLDSETDRFIRFAETYTRQSKGAFDLTIYPIAYLWGFHGGAPAGRLSPDITRAGVKGIGMRHVSRNAKTLVIDSKYVKLDPGPMLDGYLTDITILRMRDNGIQDVLVRYGESARGLGNNQGSPWKFFLPHPFKKGERLGHLLLKNKRASSYEHRLAYAISNEVGLVSHLISPLDGQPVEHTALTATIAPTATESDALSYAIAIKGHTRAQEILPEFDRCEALIVPNKQPLEIWISPGMSSYFVADPALGDIAIKPFPEVSPPESKEIPPSPREQRLEQLQTERNLLLSP